MAYEIYEYSTLRFLVKPRVRNLHPAVCFTKNAPELTSVSVKNAPALAVKANGSLYGQNVLYTDEKKKEVKQQQINYEI